MTLFSTTTVTMVAGTSQTFPLPSVNPGTAVNLTSVCICNMGTESVYVTSGQYPGIAASSSDTEIASGASGTITPGANDAYFAAIAPNGPSVIAVGRGI